MIKISLGRGNPRCHAYWDDQARRAVRRARATGDAHNWQLADTAAQDAFEVHHPHLWKVEVAIALVLTVTGMSAAAIALLR